MGQIVRGNMFEMGFNAFLLLFALVIVVSSVFNLFDTERNFLYAILGIIICVGSIIRLYLLTKNT